MIEAYQLLKQIKQSENELVPMAMETVAKCINIFAEYMNCVIDIEVYSRSITGWSRTTEYLFRQKDERRRETHTLAAEACRTLNEICDMFSISRVCDFDPEDRQAVARFAGETVYAIYNHGISGHYTFDEILNESAEKNIVFEEKTAGQLFDGEE